MSRYCSPESQTLSRWIYRCGWLEPTAVTPSVMLCKFLCLVLVRLTGLQPSAASAVQCTRDAAEARSSGGTVLGAWGGHAVMSLSDRAFTVEGMSTKLD